MNSSLTHGQNLHAEREFFRAQDAEADRKLPEIASRLHISVLTARNHIQNVLEKVEVHSTAEAVAFAFQKHLI